MLICRPYLVLREPILSNLTSSLRRRKQWTKSITTWRTQNRDKAKGSGGQSRQSCECKTNEHQGGRGRREFEYYVA